MVDIVVNLSQELLELVPQVFHLPRGRILELQVESETSLMALKRIRGPGAAVVDDRVRPAKQRGFNQQPRRPSPRGCVSTLHDDGMTQLGSDTVSGLLAVEAGVLR